MAFGRFPAPDITQQHVALANLLARRDPDLWAWFHSDRVRADASEALRLELFQRAGRLERADHAALYADADQIADAMGLGAAPTLWRGDAEAPRNAVLYFDPADAHVVFEGDALTALDAAELRFVLGHELAHHRLWTLAEARVWTAHRFLQWASQERGCAPAYRESARLLRLHTEIFADRYGLWALGDLDGALRALARVGARADDLGGAAFLAAAETAIAGPDPDAKPAAARRHAMKDGGEPSIPEVYLRAALLAAWAHDGAAAEGRTRVLIDGAPPLERLDLLAQERLADLTRWMLLEFLGEPWGRVGLLRDHARLFSEELADALGDPRRDDEDVDALRAAISSASANVREYLAFVLLDFVTADPQIEDVMLAAALLFAEDFDLSGPFKDVAAQELKTTKSKLAAIEKNAVGILAKAEIALGEPAAEPAREEAVR